MRQGENLLVPPAVYLDHLWHLVVISLWDPETYLKLLFVALASPFWWPLARAMYREVMPVLRDEPGRRPAPSLDPFLSIPLASYRARRAGSTGRIAPLALAPRAPPRRRGS